MISNIHIAQTQAGPSPQVETITPEIAQDLLSRNYNNRNVRQNAVAYLKEEMLKGRWLLNGETIKIGDDGTLLDGQHRLHAVVASGVTIKSLVVRGLDPATFHTIDIGKVRSHADYLKIAGYNGSLTTLAAAARISMGFDAVTGEFEMIDGKLPGVITVQYCENHPGLVESVKGQAGDKFAPKSMLAACRYIFSVVDPEWANMYFEGLSSGAGLKEGDPTLAVRNRLMMLKHDTGRGGQQHQRMLVSYLVQGFNYLRAGKPLKQPIYAPTFKIVLEGLAGAMKQ